MERKTQITIVQEIPLEILSRLSINMVGNDSDVGIPPENTVKRQHGEGYRNRNKGSAEHKLGAQEWYRMISPVGKRYA